MKLFSSITCIAKTISIFILVHYKHIEFFHPFSPSFAFLFSSFEFFLLLSLIFSSDWCDGVHVYLLIPSVAQEFLITCGTSSKTIQNRNKMKTKNKKKTTSATHTQQDGMVKHVLHKRHVLVFRYFLHWKYIYSNISFCCLFFLFFFLGRLVLSIVLFLSLLFIYIF